MPDDAMLTQLYAPDYLAQHYASGGSSELGDEERDAAGYIASLGRGTRVLDIGCGAGDFLARLQHLGLRAEGYETNADTASMLAHATGAIIHHGAFGAMERCYRAIHLGDVLEHIPDPLVTLTDALGVVEGDGVVVIRGPLEAQANLFERSLRIRRRAIALVRPFPPSTMPPWHVTLFSLTGWRALLERANLRVLHERVYEVNWPVSQGDPLGMKTILKRASRALSSSALGQTFKLGNRVLSVTCRK